MLNALKSHSHIRKVIKAKTFGKSLENIKTKSLFHRKSENLDPVILLSMGFTNLRTQKPDRNTIKVFLKLVQVEASVEYIIRLGKYDETKTRTIKVVLKTMKVKKCARYIYENWRHRRLHGCGKADDQKQAGWSKKQDQERLESPRNPNNGLILKRIKKTQEDDQ